MNRELVLRLLDRSHALISSARLEGASVHDLEGRKLGSLHSVMIDKKSGRVRYAVMLLEGSGDLLQVHPLPWGMLDYDESLGGYRVDLTVELIARAPNLTLDQGGRPREIDHVEVARFYGLPLEDAPVPMPIEENDFNAQTI